MKTLRLSHLFNQHISATNSIEITSEKGSFLKIDILDRTKLQSLFNTNSFDIVIHLAALTGIRPSLQHEQHYRQVNEQGFKNVVELAEEHGVKKIIYASSSSVYGNCTDYPFTELSDTEHPLNPYASTKKNNELFAKDFAQAHNITLFGLRFFTVYGPWTRPDMATFQFH
jgi:UDP-glucuronate 4-epimerase